MAMAIFNKKAKESGIDVISLSAGLFADGSCVSKNAIAALENSGISDFSHTSVQLCADLIDKCDYIFGISKRHTEAIRAAFPDAAEKIFSFPKDIPDPYGGNLDVYTFTLGEIEKGVDEIIRTLFGNDYGNKD